MMTRVAFENVLRTSRRSHTLRPCRLRFAQLHYCIIKCFKLFSRRHIIRRTTRQPRPVPSKQLKQLHVRNYCPKIRTASVVYNRIR